MATFRRPRSRRQGDEAASTFATRSHLCGLPVTVRPKGVRHARHGCAVRLRLGIANRFRARENRLREVVWLEVRVLGPLEVAGPDSSMRALPAKQRRLLAALVVHRGTRASVDSLLEAVWDGSAPASARKVLQIYVSQLRRRLPPELAIRTDDGGYTLEFDPQLLDSTRFERLLADGRSALADGNAALAHS